MLLSFLASIAVWIGIAYLIVGEVRFYK
jgi:hypothetical protein